jgi:hypothetical protein
VGGGRGVWHAGMWHAGRAGQPMPLRSRSAAAVIDKWWREGAMPVYASTPEGTTTHSSQPQAAVARPGGTTYTTTAGYLYLCWGLGVWAGR